MEELFKNKPYLRYYYNVEKANSEYRVLKTQKNNEYFVEYNSRALASTIAPKKAAQRLIENTNFKDTNVVGVLGLGNPYLSLLINDTIEEGKIILFIDYSLDLFVELRDLFFKDILQVPGRHLFCGENSLSLLWNYVDSLPLEKFKGIKFIKNSGSISLCPGFYQSVEKNLQKLFSARISDLLTKFEFERIWVKNTIYNTIEYTKYNKLKYKILQLKNKFQNVPGLLVSAGPSLKDFCPLIKAIRDKVFIMSCDTSLKVLLNFGIIPDAVMTLDAQTHSYFHFMGINIESYPIFADLVASPKLLRDQRKAPIVFTTTVKYSRDYTGKNTKEMTAGAEIAIEQIGEIGELQSGGSVATSAFDALRYMGFNLILMVGQDLAYTGREIHSSGTHHNEKWLTLIHRKQSLEKINEAIIRKRKTKYIPSANGSSVITDHVLEIYREWFEKSINNLDLKVYNITKNGALIDGVQNLNNDTCLEMFKNIPNHKFFWKNLNPWKEYREEYFDVPFQENPEFARYLLNELKVLDSELEKIENFGLSDKDIVLILQEKIQQNKYLQPILRKETTYLSRNQNSISDNKQKEILLNSLKTEIKSLKRLLVIATRT